MYFFKIQIFLILKDVSGCCYIFIEMLEGVWVSGKDNFIFINLKGVVLYCQKIFNEFFGMYLIKKDKKLIYINDEYNIIIFVNFMEKEMINLLIKSFEWKFKCLSYCWFIDDIFVGMYNKSKEEGQVFWYS